MVVVHRTLFKKWSTAPAAAFSFSPRLRSCCTVLLHSQQAAALRLCSHTRCCSFTFLLYLLRIPARSSTFHASSLITSALPIPAWPPDKSTIYIQYIGKVPQGISWGLNKEPCTMSFISLISSRISGDTGESIKIAQIIKTHAFNLAVSSIQKIIHRSYKNNYKCILYYCSLLATNVWTKRKFHE